MRISSWSCSRIRIGLDRFCLIFYPMHSNLPKMRGLLPWAFNVLQDFLIFIRFMYKIQELE